MSNDASSKTRACAAVGVLGVAAFAAICGGVQFARRDLDWIAAPLSLYLTGPFGAAVVAAYVALAFALIAIGAGFRGALSGRARSAAPLLLFVVGASALVLTALSEQRKAADASGFWALVHLIAAQTAFLCVTVAMLLQSWRLRGDARWRARFVAGFVLAAIAFVALWIYVLDHALPRGASQKIVIALILVWLGWASLRLWRGPARSIDTASFSSVRR